MTDEVSKDPEGPLSERLDPLSEGTSAHWVRHLQENPLTNTAWTALSHRYTRRLQIYAAHQLGPEMRRYMDPDDIINEAWMRVVQNVGRFEYRRRGSLYNWLCLQVRRVVLDKRRSMDRRPPAKYEADLNSSSHIGLHDPPAPGPGPATEVVHDDLRGRLINSLEKVPPPYREVLVAIYLEGKSRSEAARDLGRKPNTISQQTSRGLDHWQRALGEDPQKLI